MQAICLLIISPFYPKPFRGVISDPKYNRFNKLIGKILNQIERRLDWFSLSFMKLSQGTLFNDLSIHLNNRQILQYATDHGSFLPP